MKKLLHPNEPNDCDGDDTSNPRKVIGTDMDKSEITRWKQQSLKLLGKQVKIIYEKKGKCVGSGGYCQTQQQSH